MAGPGHSHELRKCRQLIGVFPIVHARQRVGTRDEIPLRARALRTQVAQGVHGVCHSPALDVDGRHRHAGIVLDGEPTHLETVMGGRRIEWFLERLVRGRDNQHLVEPERCADFAGRG